MVWDLARRLVVLGLHLQAGGFEASLTGWWFWVFTYRLVVLRLHLQAGGFGASLTGWWF